MTVGELLERLEEMPKDADVVACVMDGEEVRDVDYLGDLPWPQTNSKTVVMLS